MHSGSKDNEHGARTGETRQDSDADNVCRRKEERDLHEIAGHVCDGQDCRPLIRLPALVDILILHTLQDIRGKLSNSGSSTMIPTTATVIRQNANRIMTMPERMTDTSMAVR